MKKSICDICGGDLYLSYNLSQALETEHTRWYTCRKPFHIKENIFSRWVHSMFLSGHSDKELELCGKCFDDFKEYVLRKTKYTGLGVHEI